LHAERAFDKRRGDGGTEMEREGGRKGRDGRSRAERRRRLWLHAFLLRAVHGISGFS
jgi:hypothetical protein